jgi:hypothetical protein
MIEDVFVVDATVHGFNFAPENFRQPFMHDVIRMTYHFAFDILHPQGDPRYRLDYEQFADLFKLYPALMEHVLFGESQIDAAIYHGVPMYGLFGDGSSPIWIGEAIAKRFPHRMFVYPDLSWTHPNPESWIDSFKDRPNVLGVKLYPADMVEGRCVPVRFTDEKRVLPLIERVRAAGIKVIAVHKAVPLGPLDRDCFDVDDLKGVVETFPDLTFEIVHGGYAFAEETAALMGKHDNVWINLESNPCFSLNHADKFADIIGPLLASGRHDKIMFSTGACGMHPRPFVDSFWRFEMPRGYPPLTEEMKRGMLGLNCAQLHGWNVDAMKRACRKDEFGLEGKALKAPWSLVRAA